MTHTPFHHTNLQRPTLSGARPSSQAYGPYGAQTRCSHHALAFTGQRRDQRTGGYHLGNGHRMFDPVLMRFHAPDRLSPFSQGGINAYAYCFNDPINFHDPSGRVPILFTTIRNMVASVVNLAISVTKGYRGYRTLRDFNVNTGYGGTRTGVVASTAAETPVARMSAREIALTVFGAASAGAGLVTSAVRVFVPNSEPLMWTDASFATVATALSFYELWTLATTPTDRRYNTHLRAVSEIRETRM
ncbi:RHS repeat-associated core domain-containing protein [Pseudomonas sp. RP23018S]|uniref:RHS repeat-associated core domain-containing protein n=1 Tax=Pseudomonas sp. RP23018S TaxID=3096037 RepID=UPI002ACA5C73|nr:RHS repeat-associated core domain-containing protein [Pseudomonas sp. RP23018S]MDZ5604065.1 RHS repeat-associated core domain-containing protein [Pseudomonas sp. RP23018S]